MAKGRIKYQFRHPDGWLWVWAFENPGELQGDAVGPGAFEFAFWLQASVGDWELASNLAHAGGALGSPGEQLYHAQQAAALARVSALSALRRARDYELKVAEVRAALDREGVAVELNAEAPVEQLLLNAAARERKWGIVMRLVAFCEFDRGNVDAVLSMTWAKYVTETLSHETRPAAARAVLERLATSLGPEAAVACRPRLLLGVLEEMRINRRWKTLWAAQTLRCMAPTADLATEYKRALDCPDWRRDDDAVAIRCAFLHAVLKYATDAWARANRAWLASMRELAIVTSRQFLPEAEYFDGLRTFSRFERL